MRVLLWRFRMIDDACGDCGFHDGLHLRGCSRSVRGLALAKREPLSTGDRLLVSGLVVAAFAMVAFLVFVMSGCHVGELAAPCDTMTLTGVELECRAAVRENCARDGGAVDESCPTLKACHERIEHWSACDYGDAGVPVSVGGGAS